MRLRRAFAVLGLLTCALACSTIFEDLPQGPTPTSTPAPIPVVVVPVPIPTAPPATLPPATPPGNPGPTPAPGATPTPAPTSAPPTGSCSLPPGTGSGANCTRQSPSFLGQVDAAISQLAQQRPDIFNLNDQRGNGGYYIVKHGDFMSGVVSNLRARGLCAIVDTNADDEIAVKNTNAFNDQYDIILSSGHVFRGDGSYTATCTPAWF